MPPSGACGQFREIDLEKRIHFQAVRADVGEPDPEVGRAVESAQERVRDVHPLAVARDMHHVGLHAWNDGAGQTWIFKIADIPLLKLVRAETADVEITIVRRLP